MALAGTLPPRQPWEWERTRLRWGSGSSPNLPALCPTKMRWRCSWHHLGVGGLSPITDESPHCAEGSVPMIRHLVLFPFFFFFTPSSLDFIVKLQTFPSASLRATTFPTLPSSETPEGSRKREVCDKQMGNRENSQTKRGMRRRREQGADSWPLGREGEAGGLLR